MTTKTAPQNEPNQIKSNQIKSIQYDAKKSDQINNDDDDNNNYYLQLQPVYQRKHLEKTKPIL